ncbi:MAG: ABC transporter permease [Bdellovibrionales bacterium]|nr:ABC transporter permease [Bdellovibrionales bacterium]
MGLIGSFLNGIASFAVGLKTHGRLIARLAYRDFQQSYMTSALGIVWVFLQPLVTFFIMWFFFSKVAKFKPTSSVPYVAWLLPGIVAWNFFSATALSGTSLFRDYSFLMRRRDLSLLLLPLIRILSGLMVSVFFFVVLCLVLFLSDVFPSWSWFGVLYYQFCITCLLYCLILLTASLGLFLGDVGNILGVVLQLGFWASPVLWDLASYPAALQPYMQWNPLFYPITGFRASLLDEGPFPETKAALMFWGTCGVLLFLSSWVFSRLRPKFGDVI